MIAYTDYPRFEGDRKKHRVEVVGYDHDKYCRLSDGREVKAGYIYRSPQRRPVHHATLMRQFPTPMEYE